MAISKSYAKKLEAGGIDRNQAEVQAETLSQLFAVN